MFVLITRYIGAANGVGSALDSFVHPLQVLLYFFEFLFLYVLLGVRRRDASQMCIVHEDPRLFKRWKEESRYSRYGWVRVTPDTHV